MYFKCLVLLDYITNTKIYFKIKNTEWAWKALRLLAKRSAYYFMQNQNVKTISEYLDAICNKLNKEFTNEQQQSNKNQQQPLAQQQSENLQSQKFDQESPDTNENQQQNNQTQNSIIDNIDNIENPDENSQLGNDDESVQLNDDQLTNVNSSITNQNLAMNTDVDMNKMSEKTAESESLIKSSSSSSEKKRKLDPDLIHIENKISKDDFDSELIKLISENTNSTEEWKEIAVNLKMDEDTISFIVRFNF